MRPSLTPKYMPPHSDRLRNPDAEQIARECGCTQPTPAGNARLATDLAKKGSPVRRGDRVRIELSVDVEYRAAFDSYTGLEADGVRDTIDMALAQMEAQGIPERSIRATSFEVVRKPMTESEYRPPRPH